MPSLSAYFLFICAALALLLTPGPAVLYIVARSIHQGRAAGFVSIFGIGIGTLCHVAAASLGLSALLMSFPMAFGVVKLLGAAYLLYLGVGKFFSKEEVISDEPAKRESLGTIFRHGIVVNLLNPKTTLFFFAFLPQFVRVGSGPIGIQILFLGLTLVALGAITDGMYAYAAGSLGNLLRGNLRFARGQRYFAASVYIVLGIATAFGSMQTK